VWPGGVPQGGDDHPVMCIGWTDAQAYIAWLNTKAKDRRYRLPSEAEWEYAARAGSTGRRPWDPPTGPAPIEEACRHANIGDLNYRRYIDDLPSVACDDGYPFTAPVGSFPANAFGLVDMLGNAYEWTADCWVPEHTQNPKDGRPATADEGGDCSKRTMKGGGLSSADWYLRVSTRGADPVPRTRLVVIGFRVAADLR
jgi:formylglycine-generating enzyme required for sulfatase activity